MVQARPRRLVQQLIAIAIEATVQSPIRQHEVDVRLRVARSQCETGVLPGRQVPVAARVEQSVRGI